MKNMLVAPPFPFHLDPDHFDINTQYKEAWKVRPELFFRCKIRPLESDGSKSLNSQRDIPLQLMFYSKFKECNLTPNHPLQRAGNEMIFEPMPVPILHVDHVRHALCRVPLMPCYLHGNSTPTIPPEIHRSLYPDGQCDNAARPGSRLYEVNHFMWSYGRPKTSLRSESFSDSEKRKLEQMKETVKKRAKTQRNNVEFERRTVSLTQGVERRVMEQVISMRRVPTATDANGCE